MKWTRVTPAKIASWLGEDCQIRVSASTVAKILKEMHYSLKTNRKTIPINSSPERNDQFTVIQKRREEFELSGNPRISVDTKKKELVGLFKNPGRLWSQKATQVYDHDFRSVGQGIAVPYGIYDTGQNQGSVFVGTSHDTAEFAVNAIEQWWRYRGQYHYHGKKELLILADAGGSNSYRSRLWKLKIQEKLCDRHGLTVTVCHYPTGASKWNPVEHRLFSEITKNWAGTPLTDYTLILKHINTTTTSAGLKVKSYLDRRTYHTGIRVSDEDFRQLSITKGTILAQWNYTIHPRIH